MTAVYVIARLPRARAAALVPTSHAECYLATSVSCCCFGSHRKRTRARENLQLRTKIKIKYKLKINIKRDLVGRKL
jgi:hypothetical protein